MDDNITYSVGFAETDRTAAALLYDQAFGPKLSLAIKNRARRLSVLRESLLPDFGLAAYCNAELVGLAGFHTAQGSLTGGMTGRRLLAQLGLGRGLWAAAVLSLYERRPEAGELVMDGIAVREDMRGRGIGGQLLERLALYAGEHGYARIRLDVIDTNPAARRLYERKGFRPVSTERFPYLRWLLGFGAATRMELQVADSAFEHTGMIS